MLDVGNLIIHSAHGICQIDDISDKEFSGTTKKYYTLHPIDETHGLTISTPVDNDKIKMMDLVNKEEAENVMEVFHADGVDWIEKPNLRIQTYTAIVKTGDRTEIAKVAITLLRKKHEQEALERKFSEIDKTLLSSIQNILYKELAIAFNTSKDAVSARVNQSIKEHL
ncbi:CarD family transcriptional regulator [Oceanobacillus halotolerans]|uniref:CarD family transcriptional regulator n=1 Tax=Oceanobacillus halotolerans TaxID=2663380 RepID=UPI0013DB4148|nr:CarD family transcriptional regulator [Oceanobacillus halotolerans]